MTEPLYYAPGMTNSGPPEDAAPVHGRSKIIQAVCGVGSAIIGAGSGIGSVAGFQYMPSTFSASQLPAYAGWSVLGLLGLGLILVSQDILYATYQGRAHRIISCCPRPGYSSII